MRFRPETLGLLVRPRILASASVLLKGANNPGASSLFTLKPTCHSIKPCIDPLLVFGKPLNVLFSDIQLGNTAVDISTTYTAQVVSYLIKTGSVCMFVDRSNIQETLAKVKKRFGARTNLKIVSVGVRFFCGMEQLTTGELRPINPWMPVTKDGQETIWFYKPWELVPMTEILKYESVNNGDLVLFQKCHGLVVKKKLLNKPKFFLTSSWSCYSITLLNHTGDGFTRFLPSRFFAVHRPTSPITDEDQEKPP